MQMVCDFRLNLLRIMRKMSLCDCNVVMTLFAVHQVSNDGWTPLCFACENGNIEVVNALLAASASADHRTVKGGSPLIIAAQFGHAEVVRALLACPRVDVNARNHLGFTPLMRAADQVNMWLISPLFDGNLD